MGKPRRDIITINQGFEGASKGRAPHEAPSSQYTLTNLNEALKQFLADESRESGEAEPAYNHL